VETFLIPETIDKIVSTLRKRFDPYLILLFGSAAQGRVRPDSDIDIALASDQKNSPYELFLTSQELAAFLGSDVDLVDLEGASTVFRMEIFKKAKVLYNGDNNRRMWLHMRALKEYVQLNEERAPVLQRLRERRSSYE
jgi:predicted nucleotidyltransferase